jgi:hypothetical protein
MMLQSNRLRSFLLIDEAHVTDHDTKDTNGED